MTSTCVKPITSLETIEEFLLAKDSMTPKKLQKMVYYCYAWSLALLNEDSDNIEIELFSDEFEAWVHGPVVRRLYFKYKDYGYNEIPKGLSEQYYFSNPDLADILEQVWEQYGHFTGNELESISHQEDPWIEARKGLQPYEGTDRKIKKKSIFSFYNTLAAQNG